ncbi:hypothetical protein CYMTET_11203 [Cymbomonas tetramitiformis]|uniref:Uncharacterized protein n=1 Tax=Cymbomonas tetramitiformis TaxID=36881 RepID=A0AAE0LDP5_9CHLO|nr:hypothetical protein CYMTET_11203 [Cymbomonas tetramitiformis]
MASRLLESMEGVWQEAEHLRIAGGPGEGTAEARSGERPGYPGGVGCTLITGPRELGLDSGAERGLAGASNGLG